METATILKSAICRTRVYPRPNPTLFYFPGINNCSPIIDPTKFKFTETLQKNHDVILREYKNLRAKRFKNDYNSGDHQLHQGNWEWHSCKCCFEEIIRLTTL
jgi:hypothetical protein